MQGNHEILFKNDQLAKIYQQNDKSYQNSRNIDNRLDQNNMTFSEAQ